VTKKTQTPSDRQNPRGSTITDAVDTFLSRYESTNTRRSYKRALDEWQSWLQRQGVDRVENIDVLTCRQYARYLSQWSHGRTDHDDTISASTAHSYYSRVRAWLSFCRDDELITTNPAKAGRATDELPEDNKDPDRQFWSERDRKALLSFVDRRVDRTLDGDTDFDRVRVFRDRAVVRVLALSGVRGAEVFRVSDDPKRDGVAWNDVDFDRGTLRILGKSREQEYAQLPSKAVDALERYRQVLDPPTDDYPVFPSDHAPSKYAAVREQVENPDAKLDAADSVDDVIREHEVVVPAITTHGARTLLKRLCDDADLSIDGDYLKPHGGRRGLGHTLYEEGHAELAQSALRHSSIDITYEAYSDLRASDVAESVDDVLDG